MGFFKPAAQATTSQTFKRLDQLVWTLIYGGLMTLVWGMFVCRGGDTQIGSVMLVFGGLLAAAGVVLIYVRYRLTNKYEQQAKP